MFYHCAILLLFRPFIHFSFTSSSMSPHEICFPAAVNLTTLIRSYCQLHAVRRTPIFTAYVVLSSAIIALIDTTLTGAVSLPSILQDNLDHFASMSVCHGFANHAIMILQVFVHQASISLDRSPDYTTSFPIVPMTSEGPLLLSLRVFRLSNKLFGVSTDRATINIASRDSVLRQRLFFPFSYQGLPLLSARDLKTQ